MRAKVHPEFIEINRKFAIRTIKEIHEEAQSYRDRSFFLQENASTIHNLVPLAKNDPMAIDRFKTKLRGLEYEEFGIEANRDKLYLKGITKPVTISKFRSKGQVNSNWKFDAGRYIVYIDPDTFYHQSSGGVHMIPERSPNTATRHPHSKALSNGNSPLDYTPSNCWSGFAQLVSGAAEDRDIVSMFRYIHLFLGRWHEGKEWSTCKYISFLVPL